MFVYTLEKIAATQEEIKNGLETLKEELGDAKEVVLMFCSHSDDAGKDSAWLDVQWRTTDRETIDRQIRFRHQLRSDRWPVVELVANLATSTTILELSCFDFQDPLSLKTVMEYFSNDTFGRSDALQSLQLRFWAIGKVESFSADFQHFPVNLKELSYESGQDDDIAVRSSHLKEFFSKCSELTNISLISSFSKTEELFFVHGLNRIDTVCKKLESISIYDWGGHHRELTLEQGVQVGESLSRLPHLRELTFLGSILSTEIVDSLVTTVVLHRPIQNLSLHHSKLGTSGSAFLEAHAQKPDKTLTFLGLEIEDSTLSDGALASYGRTQYVVEENLRREKLRKRRRVVLIPRRRVQTVSAYNASVAAERVLSSQALSPEDNNDLPI